MAEADKPDTKQTIQAAIRAKREKTLDRCIDLESKEAELLAEIERFDLPDGIPPIQEARPVARGLASVLQPELKFPEIIEVGSFRNIADRPMPETNLSSSGGAGSLLDSLRAQAEGKLQQADLVRSQQHLVNKQIDQVLKALFFYVHDMVQQLNVVKPVISRCYHLIEDKGLENLEWQAGFSDYRAQSPSAGGLVELVTLSYQLANKDACRIQRSELGVERFRNFLADYGLFNFCREFRNPQGQLTHAEFEIPAKLAVTVKWRADFALGVIKVETRNLERLGPVVYTLHPHAVDTALCDEFTRLILGQPNQFRELSKR